MSDSPPKPAGDPGSSEAAKVPATSSLAEPHDAPVNTEPSTISALDDAANAMAATALKSDAPAAAADAIVKNSPAETTAAPEIAKSEAPKPAVDVFQLPATTSGMHQQYVAPGVARQSLLSSMKFQIAFFGLMFAVSLFMFVGGGHGDFGVGDNGKTSSTVTTAPLVDDPTTTHAFPDPNNAPTSQPTPQADFTVNAATIGGANPPSAVKHGDAGANKGGYAEESADLQAAEAMVDKNPVKALQMVDQHDVDYPRGMLDPEARVIRVEAYAKKGDDLKALQLGNDFLEDYPHSPRAGRVMAIVEAVKNKLDSGSLP